MAQEKLKAFCAKHKITITFVEEPSLRPYTAKRVAKPASGFIHEELPKGPPTQPGEFVSRTPWYHRKFTVQIACAGRSYGASVTYRMGLPPPVRGKTVLPDPKEVAKYDAHFVKQTPTVDEVLHSLLSDASGYDSARDFKDYAEGFGVSDDSIKARDTYLACGETSKRLRVFLGDLWDAAVKAAEDY